MNMIGSLRYDPSGRKRKTTSLKPRRKSRPVFQELKVAKTLAMQQMEAFDKKYPSYTGPTKYQPAQDKSWKKEVSKNFTVAPAYNKGAYQVVPRNEVEHIGR